MGKDSSSIGAKPKRQRANRQTAQPQAQAARNQPQPPVEDPGGEFGDGIKLSKDWRTFVGIICEVIKQTGETCWAIVLTRLLQAIFNINQTCVENHKTFLYQDLISHLKPDEKKKGKKTASLALKNIQAALKHMREVGLLKIRASGTTKPGSGVGYKAQWDFTTTLNAGADMVKDKVDISPVGIVLDITGEFSGLRKGFYTVRGAKMVEGEMENVDRHMLIIVGYGYTKERKLFFLVQNSWGEDNWGVKGYGRIIIDDNSNFMLIYPC